MRLFVAVDLPDAVKDRLVTLRTDIPDTRWVERPSLHLTLRFLGDRIDPIRLTPIIKALNGVKAAPFSLTISGAGRFPPGDRRPARVLWVGVKPQPALGALHAAVERALAGVDFPPEDRPFSAHITLARLRAEGRVEALDRFLDTHAQFAAGTFDVAEFHLMSSILTSQGPNYRREASFPLTN